jgi:uncharacterized protein
MPADSSGWKIAETPTGVEFSVKVVPGASRTKVVGVLGTALKIAVAAPPEAGKANAAVIALLAAALSVKKAGITIISGHTQPLKRVAIAGVCAADVRRLPKHPPGA